MASQTFCPILESDVHTIIDNAAGVATSDREVNSKIALDTACRAVRVTAAERADLLGSARAEVADAVLRSCEDQVLAISLAEAQAAQVLNRHERLINTFEQGKPVACAAALGAFEEIEQFVGPDVGGWDGEFDDGGGNEVAVCWPSNEVQSAG